MVSKYQVKGELLFLRRCDRLLWEKSAMVIREYKNATRGLPHHFGGLESPKTWNSSLKSTHVKSMKIPREPLLSIPLPQFP